MAEHYKAELGRRIKARREELGMTQKDLADATHYKEAQSVSRWERGENVPADLDTVAAALQWTLSELVAGVEPPNRKVARQFGLVNDEGVDRAVPDLMGSLPPKNASEHLAEINQRLDRLQAVLEELAGKKVVARALEARDREESTPPSTGHRRAV